MSAAKRESTQRAYHERMLRVLDYIETHLDEELSLVSLAEVACFSRFHFHYIFRGVVGESLGGYIRRLRLEKAWRRLSETADSVTRIAHEAGYGSHEAFNHAFKAHFGINPSDARKAASIEARLASSDGRLPEALASRLSRVLSPEAFESSLGVEVRRIEPIRVVAMRQVGPYSEIGALYARLMSWAGRHRRLAPNVRVLGLCYDDPEMTPPEECRYDACLSLAPSQAMPVDEAVRELVIQGGEYAMAVHVGRHCDLPDTYAVVCGQWCPRFGREIRSVPAIENYVNDAHSTPVEDLRTEIYIPLEEEA